MQSVFLILVRLVLVLAGLVFAASLLLALVVLAALWGLRALWARLTGQPVTPFVMRVDPLGGFGRVFRARRRQPMPPEAAPAPGGRGHAQDVTDVEPKQPHREP